ncbi:hypothetical protein FJZ31_36500 [Candidatus Poribacteria bacterium]|nr:hypothetical protein [Candidatus Poribacteria bacterium]
MFPERISLPEGAVVEIMVIEKETLEPSENAKRRFWELVGVGESGKSDVSTHKHEYLLEALDER